VSDVATEGCALAADFAFRSHNLSRLPAEGSFEQSGISGQLSAISSQLSATERKGRGCPTFVILRPQPKDLAFRTYLNQWSAISSQRSAIPSAVLSGVKR
jgi:hypothetical protein